MQAVIRKPKPFYAKLHNQVIIAMVAAIVLGAVWPSVAVQNGRVLKSGYEEGYFRQPSVL